MRKHCFFKIVLTVCCLMMCSLGMSAQTTDAADNAALEKAAKAGDPISMCQLAYNYYQAKEYKKAAKWFKKSGEKGLAVGKRCYGEMLLEGIGVNRNRGGALKWIEQAAQEGDSEAMMDMSDFYKNGLDGYEMFLGEESRIPESYKIFVVADSKTSREWLDKAVAAGNLRAVNRKLELCRTTLEKLPLWEIAAAAGDKDALTELGKYYSNPEDANYDYEKALDYFTRADNQELLTDLNKAEEIRRAQEESRKQQENELARLRAKAEAGDLGAILELAHKLRKEGSDQAASWFRLAADKGSGEGMLWLADCYYFGNGVSKNREEAFRLYRQAEASGMANDAYLLYNIGFLYSRGEGVARDVVKARKYLNAAKAAGYTSASEELDKLDREKAQQKKADLKTRKATKIRVLGKTYIANYELDGISVRQGIRFDPNGRLVITTGMMGRQETHRGEWSQNGTEITTNSGTLWLDASGNLHQFYSNGAEIIYYRK